jgi:hypothetical protein
MKKLIIESKWFQRRFLKAVKKRILNETSFYCCNVFTWHILFCHFNELKVVNENHNSVYLRELIKSTNLRLMSSINWFPTTKDRLAFLDECLEKLK